MLPLFNSVVRSPFISSGTEPPQQSAEGIASPTTYFILGLAIAVVLFVIVRVLISIRKDRTLAKERAKENEAFIAKILGKTKIK